MSERARALGGSTKLLSQKEAAEMLAVSYSTFRKRWRQWRIPHVPIGGLVKYYERDLQHWIEQQRV